MDIENEINKSYVSSSTDQSKNRQRWNLKEVNYNENNNQASNTPGMPLFESPEVDLFYYVNRRRR